MDGKVAVVYPNPSLRFCKYFDWQSRSTYPLFGKVGNGFGGMEIKGAQGVSVIKATAYPGRYVHHMKALGLPNKAAPKQCESKWFGMQWSKLQTLVAQIGQLADMDVAGLRVEMRVNQLEASWSEQERVLASMFQEICKHLDVKELELEAIHQDSVEALGKAEGACLFQCPGGSAEKAAGWRHQNYGRLLFHIGLSDKFTNRFALKQALEDSPWGPEPDATRQGQGPHECWPVNPTLPPGVAHIEIPKAASAKEVAAMCRQFDSHFNWHEIVAFLGFPEAAAKLQSACTKTKWRRQMGKNTGGVHQFTTALKTSRGGVAGPLGNHLLLAAVNLVAMNLQDEAHQLDQSNEQEMRTGAGCQGNNSVSTDQ